MHSVIHRLWHVTTPACFGTEELSSGSHYSKVYKPTCQFMFCSSYTNDENLQMLKYQKIYYIKIQQTTRNCGGVRYIPQYLTV